MQAKAFLFAMNIIFEHSPFWLLLLIPIFLGLSYWLYFIKAKDKSQAVKSGLALLRFLAFLILGVLLLSPLIQYNTTEEQKPFVIVAQDASNSMLNYTDSNLVKNELEDKIKQYFASQEELEVVFTNFSKNVNQDWDQNFQGSVSNFDALFNQSLERFGARKPAAMFLISDGNVNRGMNPLLSVEKLNFPVYTLRAGDTLAYADSRMLNIQHNDFSFLNNQFPIRISFEANLMEGEEITYRVSTKGKQVAAGKRSINSNDQQFEQQIMLNATEVGIQEYKVEISSTASELNQKNNVLNFRIEVLENRKKVLLVSELSHPDIKAIRAALSEVQNLELDLVWLKDYSNQDLAKYEAIILYQLPGNKASADGLMAKIKTLEIPTWFILGKQSNLAAFNRSQDALEFNGNRGRFDEVTGIISPDFKPFSLSSEKDFFLNAPPLISPFATYKANATADVLAYQQVGSVSTERPLWLMLDASPRVSVLAAEGLWRWRLYNYATEENHEAFDQLIQKNIQFLTANQEKDRFRLRFPRSIQEQEPILFEAEVYDKSFTRTDQASVSIALKDADGKDYNYQFLPQGDLYRLRVPYLPAGLYTFKVSAKLANENFDKKGSFTVQSSNLEQREITANHQLLKDISKKTGGLSYSISEVDLALESIGESQDIKPIVYNKEELIDLIQNKWLLLLPLLLLSVEWLLRKRYGRY